MSTCDGAKPSATSNEDRHTALCAALGRLVGVADLTRVDEPVNISAFKAAPSKYLDRSGEGVQVIRRRNDLYVLLTEEQIITLAANTDMPRSLADTLADIPAPPLLSLADLHVPSPTTEQFALPIVRK